MKANLIYRGKKNKLLFEVALAGIDDEQLVEVNNELSLGFSIEELRSIQEYFKKEKRNPTDVELQTISQTWSEHCYHKTFKGKILLGKRKFSSLFKTFIAKTTREIS